MKYSTRFLDYLKLNFWNFIPYILLGVYSLFLAYYLKPNIMFDDAAITFRYAERIVDGQGFTYNDHEHVLGASNPLYTLILAILHYFGINIETAAFALGVVLFVTSVLLTYRLTSNLSNEWVGLLSGFALASDGFYRYMALSGMESVLSVVLGLLSILAISSNRLTLAGIFLGFAVWNKLDAGILALVIAGSYLLIYRKIPWKIIIASLLVVLPWFLFALFYYGSVIPNSMIAKMHHEIGANFNHFWIFEFLTSDHRILYLVLVASLIFTMKKLNLSENITIHILAGWFVLHGLTFSVLNLGGNYPWYLTVLIPPFIILATYGLFTTYRLFTGDSFFKKRRIPDIILILGMFVLFITPSVTLFKITILDELKMDNPVKPFEAFENDRRLAGIFLDQYASKDEVVQSGYGWVAVESGMPFNDMTLLNSHIMLKPESYLVDHGRPHQVGSNAPIVPDGYIPLATFNLASDMFPGHSWFTVFGLPNSTIGQSNIRYLQYRLTDLPPPVPVNTSYGLENINIHDHVMDAHPPSGSVFKIENDNMPLHLIFTPGFNSEVPKNKTDGVTFKVIVDEQTLYDEHIRPTDSEKLVKLPIKNSDKILNISFITEPGPDNNSGYDWAYWKGVKFIVGDGLIDEKRIQNNKLKDKWCTYNLCKESSEH